MIDSTNPRSMVDNIRKLWEKFSKISGDLLPSRSTATTGQILKLTGENKTPSWADEYRYAPPAYSETEVNTGQKWIDGKDIYCLVIKGSFPEITSTSNVVIATITNIETITNLIVETTTSDLSTTSINRFTNSRNSSNGNIGLNGVITAYSEGSYILIISYTKPDPAPETRDDDTPEEVKETKTRKKTTK